MTFRTKNRLYKVYHIHLKEDPDIKHGYVGVTRHNLSYRLSQHYCSPRPVGNILRSLNKEDIVIEELAMLPKEDALDLEYQLRPKRNMGWNCMAGGNHRTVRCPGCGKYLPKRKTGAFCMKCNDTRFKKGQKPFNYGCGEHFTLIAPDGTIYHPEAFTAFCKEHHLNPQNLRKVANGKRHHSQGWIAKRCEG